MSIKTANHHTIRKVITAVGSCFDNLTLITYNKENEETKRVRVPIAYAQKEKFINRLYGDYDISKKIQVALPRLSYELTSFNYAPDRKLPITGKMTKKVNQLYQLNAVPYDFNFEMTLYVRNLEDGFQLCETILPYFNADFNIIINDNPEFNTGRALPIVLNRVNYDVEYEGGAESATRMVTYTFQFTAKGFLYPPTMEYDRIREVIVNIKNLNKNTDIYLKLDKEGSGSFELGEKVYQGLMEEHPDAYGRVVEFDKEHMILHLSDPDGIFISNMQIHGAKTLAHYDVICGCHHKEPLIGSILPESNKTWVTIDVKPDPEDAEFEDDWKYKIDTKEFE